MMDTKNVFTITDPGLDPDDIVNAWFLSKLHQQRQVNWLGAIANYYPSEQRAVLLKAVIADLCVDVPVFAGGDCHCDREPHDYEFDYPGIQYDPISLFQHPHLVHAARLLKEQGEKSVTLQLISGLTDIYWLITNCENTLKRSLKEVYIMGGGEFVDGKFIADPTASNNKFDKTLDSQTVYDWFIENNIPMYVLTRHAAYSAKVDPRFYDEIDGLGSVQSYLARIHRSSAQKLWQFACSNPPGHRQNRQWFCRTLCGCDDIPASIDDDISKFVVNACWYDPLTTLWMIKPEFFNVEQVGLTQITNALNQPVEAIDYIQQALLH